MAAGGEANIVLEFSQSDKMFLYISLVLGFIALAVGFVIRGQVLAKSPGSEKMQEVGGAIHEGAIAYLKRQVATMIWFVLLISALLVVLYMNSYGTMTAVFTALSFVAGVAASYIAGYVGMDMAVRGNMRTAHAALSSYKSTLEIAFRSGSVAGLITVGMGLLGATIILLAGGGDAMKLLIGFGFGGSLAALFMRVGGGIFTKAADVGADLVGKVEAGIPEDDPRNPATIADNVGDNVGDCAGMAADIFESYEVTLVAAIVLGAATASIFDQATWMKLILFALMARGVGIIASIFGIYSVKGSDNIDSDPLTAIRKGFWLSAGIAAIGTIALAYVMMGGDGKSLIATRMIRSDLEIAKSKIEGIKAVRDQIAKESGKAEWEIRVADIKDHSGLKALNLPPDNLENLISAAIMAPPDQIDRIKPLSGFKPVSLDSEQLKSLTVVKNSTTGGEPQYLTAAEAYKSVRVFKVTEPGVPAPGSTEAPKEKTAYVLTDDAAKFKEGLAAQSQKIVGDEDGVSPQFFVDGSGNVAIGLDVPENDILLSLQRQMAGDQVFNLDTDKLKTIRDDVRKKFDEYQKLAQEATTLKDAAQEAKNAEAQKVLEEARNMPQPNPVTFTVGQLVQTSVPWWTFAACIIFGILMAFFIEILTDYYVSTHKGPVKEIAGVSNAGPAPMIIQGFALACESSVFSVLSIVVALIFPLIIFSPGDYGTLLLSFYGIALVGLGLLTTTGFILAMDTFGPISDNAQGVFEMSGAGHDSPSGSKAVQRLDAAGNTTKALTKGFAIATAVVAAVALFHSFVEEAKLADIGMRLDIPQIFLGLLIGAAAPYLFASSTINAVGRAAFQLINEVRRQFRNDPGIMAGTSKPNYANCVAIVTAAAQKELLGPAILAIALPMAVAFGFSIGAPSVGGYNLAGAQALGGFLAGAIVSGQLMAVLLANSGGMWDNAKKLIEDGLYGGKGSEAHKAGVVCDTVGDPFKDTAGPAMNPLIKVMNLVALLLAPFVIQVRSDMTNGIITGVCVVALAFSIWWSKRGSMSSAMAEAAAEASALDAAKAQAPAAESKKRITVDDDPEA
jgi:K(+)-stimulated pyrophosphate-energized sodium pump